MSTIKADTIKNKKSLAINLPNKLTIGGFSVEQGYTASATEPSNPAIGDFWWDTANDKLYRYVNNEFFEINITAATSWYGDRDLRTGAQSSIYYDLIHYNSITTLGNAADFGDVTVARTRQAACSNGTYSYRFGGSNSGTATALSVLYNVVDYFANASLGNASDFGDASSNHSDGSAHSDGTTGVVWKGLSSAIVVTNAIDKYTLDTPGNATDFGDVSSIANRWSIAEAGCGNGTRGIFWGGTNPSSPYSPHSNTIDYVTVASPGNATDFGDMNIARYAGSGTGAGTDDRCLYFGGYASGTNGFSQIDYITASTTGNAADFGDLNPATNLNYTQYYGGAAANATRALYHFSYGNNQISYVTMSTTGNATDFGDQLITNNAMQSHSSGAAS